jgi:CheY-like chemotaxis protein
MGRILNVLLVEDDQLVQYAMVEGLSDAGHVVSVAGTKNRAIEVLTHHHYYDVILLDLRLGADRGEDIFLQLRARGTPFPPVIIVSAQPMAEIKRVESVIHVAASLQKPVSIQDICETMERAVD